MTKALRRRAVVASAERGWYEFNPSVDGLGFVINRNLAVGGDLVDQIGEHEPPPDIVIVIGWVEEAAERVGADHIEGASRWLEGHPEWMSDDVIHPNDEGYAEIARRMDAELERFGL